MQRHTLSKTFKIDIGHRIWNEDMRSGRASELYDAKCQFPYNKCTSLHGHSLGVTFKIQSKSLDEHGFVIDSNLLKAPLLELIGKVDHAMMIDKSDPLFPTLSALCEKEGLKYFPVDFCPSFEAMAKFFFDECKAILAKCNDAEKQFSLLSVSITGAKMSVQAVYEEIS